MDLTIAITVGKYLMLAGIYAFVVVVFRGMIVQLAAEARMERSDASSARARRVSMQSRLSGQAPAAATSVSRAPSPLEEPAAPVPELPQVPRATAKPVPDPAPSTEPQSPASDEGEPVAAPHLRIIESGDETLKSGESISLSAAVTIGRSEENSLRLSDRFISSRHALICLRDGRRLLLDRGSTNGTFVNGERVTDEVVLRDGDRVAMGNSVFEYRAGRSK